MNPLDLNVTYIEKHISYPRPKPGIPQITPISRNIYWETPNWDKWEPRGQRGKALDYKDHEKWKQWRNQATTMNWRRVHVHLFLFQWSMMKKIWSFMFLKTTINENSQRKLATKPPYSKQTNKNQEVWIWITLLFPELKVA